MFTQGVKLAERETFKHVPKKKTITSKGSTAKTGLFCFPVWNA